MKNKRLTSYSILLLYILVIAVHHFFGYSGHFGFDDLHYANLASDLINGNINFEDHFTYRFPVILFTSLVYFVFGISDLSSSLPALLITIAILIIVFNILRDQGNKTLIIGLSLTTFSNWFLFYSDKLMPDIYVALSVVLALAIINRYKFKGDKSKPSLYGFLLAFSLLFGFMSKGTIVLILPLLLYLFISDIIQRRDMKFWTYSLLSGLALLAIYLLIIWLLTGSIMKRFDVIADNSYLNRCSYDQQSLKILLRRIFFGFFGLSIYQSLATGFIFIFAILFKRNGLKALRIDDSFSFFMVSAFILFLSSSFMTISYNSYAPMCLDPRHYLFLVPVVAIPASKIIVDFIESRKFSLQIIIALLCIAVISFFLQGNSFWRLYLPMLGLFGIYSFIEINKRVQYLFIILFAVILLLTPLEMFRYAQRIQYKKQRELVVDQLLQKNQDCTIITNEVQKRLLQYYSKFSVDQSHRFLTYEEFEADTAIGGKKLLLLNWYTRYLSAMELNDLPYYARNISPSNTPVFESNELDFSIYELKVISIPELSENALLSTFNDFESALPYWNQVDQDISSDIKFAGIRSNRIPEYSATFDYPLDSLHTEESTDLLIQCSLYCYTEEQSSSKIVISLENSSGTYFWKALEFDRYIKAYSNWWPVNFDVTIPQNEQKSDSRLKIYVWNSDSPDIYIDNFQIKITGTPDSY